MAARTIVHRPARPFSARRALGTRPLSCALPGDEETVTGNELTTRGSRTRDATEQRQCQYRSTQAYPGGMFWAQYRDCADCSYPDRSCDLRSVTKLSDVYSARQGHGTGMYSDHSRPGAIEHELRMWLPAGPRAGPPG